MCAASFASGTIHYYKVDTDTYTQGSPNNDAQITASCTNWAQVADRYCDDANDLASYSTEAEARAACESDTGCLSISDGSCDGTGYWETCSSTTGSSSSSGSCLYLKPDGSCRTPHNLASLPNPYSGTTTGALDNVQACGAGADQVFFIDAKVTHPRRDITQAWCFAGLVPRFRFVISRLVWVGLAPISFGEVRRRRPRQTHNFQVFLQSKSINFDLHKYVNLNLYELTEN